MAAACWWADRKIFCTTVAAFEIRGAENCAERGFSEQGFAATPTKGVAGYVAHIGQRRTGLR